MSLVSCYARRFSRVRPPKYLPNPRWTNSALRLASLAARRHYNDGGLTLAIEEELASQQKLRGKGVEPGIWDEYRASLNADQPNFEFKKCIPSSLIGMTVTATGFLGKQKNMGSSMSFANLEGGNGPERIQLLARSEFNNDARQALRKIKANSAVSVTGKLHLKYEAKDKKDLGAPEEGTEFITDLEIRVESIKTLNTFSRHLHLGSMMDPKERDLQIRFDEGLRQRLKFRSDVAAFARRELSDFQEVETPVLFKSTPEGAREFLVPTRNRGFAYGLPQSPQQYKQVLMASGINRYVQFARCFRDEDHRADRQPEFTQIDLEMAWADGGTVMQRVEQFVKALWEEFAGQGSIQSILPDTPFIRITYDEAMSKYGSDKPDLRIPAEIERIDQIISADFCSMLTSIENPIIEAFQIKLDTESKVLGNFIREFMDSADAEPFKQNVDGAPGIFFFDPRRPLQGLQAFGFEGAENLKAMYTGANEFEDGSLLLVQARPNLPHQGGSTMMGKLRLAIYKAALTKGLVQPDLSHHFLWVTDFPMFTPSNSTDPGQGGLSGFSATHHPFTAPKTPKDLDMLLTDPLKAKADHYDLVLNGIELGGGSRRIHSAAIQKFIMYKILKMMPDRIDDFKHLFRALEAGCPPHAGLAIGFDRLIAVMQGRDSVRDVIAFPKNSNGEDPMVESPSRVHKKQLETYHLSVHSDRSREKLSTYINAIPRKTEAKPQGEDGAIELPTLVNEEYLQGYMESLKVLPSDKTNFATHKSKSRPFAKFSPMQKYLHHLSIIPRERTSLIPWSESPKTAVLIGKPIDIANNSQQIGAAIACLRASRQSQVHPQSQPHGAVMVNSSDPIKLDLKHIISPSLKSMLQIWDKAGGGQVMLHEMTGKVGESILIGLKLEKEPSEEDRREKTMWGAGGDNVGAAIRKGSRDEAKAEDGHLSNDDVAPEEPPSDPGNLSDAAPTQRPR